MKNLSKRILVAIFGIPILLIMTYLGDWYFFSLILIIGTIALWEFFQMQKLKNIIPQKISGVIIGGVLLLGVQLGQFLYTAAFLLTALMLILINEMFRKHQNVSANIGVTLLGIFYIPLLLSCLLYLRSYTDTLLPGLTKAGFNLILIMFAAVWICDTFAYGFGSFFGRHKLFRKVSPNKTVEGAVAGLIGSILTFTLFKYLHIFPLSWTAVIAFGAAVGTVGQIGDLVESWFKRDVGVKDSSALLPGHGGMLDRFDSIIFLSPVMLIIVHILY